MFFKFCFIIYLFIFILKLNFYIRFGEAETSNFKY